MGDLLRMVFDHPQAEIVGICDESPSRMTVAARNFGITSRRIYPERGGMPPSKSRPDLVILCPATARHADYVERTAHYGAHILVEKPFAASVAEADRMIAAARKRKVMLAINWPLRRSASNDTAYRIIDRRPHRVAGGSSLLWRQPRSALAHGGQGGNNTNTGT